MTTRTSTFGVSRRAFLTALSGGVLAGCALADLETATSAPDVIAFEDFMRRSRALTGVHDLDPGLGRVYFAALDPSTLDATTITNAWYTGTYGDPHAPRVATYVGALAWSTLVFTKAPGVCGGGMGYWAKKPGTV